jgi:hypothetical protein
MANEPEGAIDRVSPLDAPAEIWSSLGEVPLRIRRSSLEAQSPPDGASNSTIEGERSLASYTEHFAVTLAKHRGDPAPRSSQSNRR